MVPCVRPPRLYPSSWKVPSDTAEIDFSLKTKKKQFDPTTNNQLGEYQLIETLEAASLRIQPPISSVSQC